MGGISPYKLTWRWLGMDHYLWTIVLGAWVVSLFIMSCVRLFNNDSLVGAVLPSSYDIWFFTTSIGVSLGCLALTFGWAAGSLKDLAAKINNYPEAARSLNDEATKKNNNSAYVSAIVALSHDRNFITVVLIGSIASLSLSVALVADPLYGNNDLTVKLTDLTVVDFANATTIANTFKLYTVAKFVEMFHLCAYFVMIVAFFFNYTSLPVGLIFGGTETLSKRVLMGAVAGEPMASSVPNLSSRPLTAKDVLLSSQQRMGTTVRM